MEPRWLPRLTFESNSIFTREFGPIKLYMESLSPLKGYQPGSIDLVLYRENTEGLFWDRKIAHDTDADEVTNTMRISRHGTERIVRAAFEEAQRRKKHRICLVDKANVLPAMGIIQGSV